jgi:hypothetical protein
MNDEPHIPSPNLCNFNPKSNFNNNRALLFLKTSTSANAFLPNLQPELLYNFPTFYHFHTTFKATFSATFKATFGATFSSPLTHFTSLVFNP